MDTREFLAAVADSALGQQMAESAWLFPTVETLHVLAVALVFGSIATVDLRLLGWAQRGRRVSEVIGELLPWTWGAFAVAVPTGLLMFMAKPEAYFNSGPLRLKLLAIVLAGVNMAVFHVLTQRHMAEWDTGRPARGARIAGALSVLLWLSVVLLGRWIGFVK